MSLVKSNGLQIGQSVTATNNFTMYQPASPDGTVRWGVGNSGSVTDIVTLNSSGNVGIGNSSPNYTPFGGTARVLSIGSSSNAQGIVELVGTQTADGVVGAVTGYNTSSSARLSQINFNRYSADNSGTITFHTNNAGSFAERMRLDSSGNLGLGVTPSAWSGLTALQVSRASISSDSGSIQIGVNTYYNGGWKYIGTGYATNYYQDSGNHVWRTAPSGTAGNAITFTQAMTLDASGNLGIGTSSPGYALDVSSQARIGNGAGQAILRLNGASSGTNLGAAIYFQNAGATNNGIGNYSAIMGGAFNADLLHYVGSANNQIFFTSGSERMRIDSSGNVGIGTSSPRSKLDADGAVTAGFSNGTYGDVLYGTYGTGYPTSGIGYFKLATNQLGAADGGMSVYTLASGTLYERMRIDSSGNLIVGRSSTSETTGGADIRVFSGGAILTVVRDSLCAIWNRLTTTGNVHEFRYNGTGVGSISVSGSATAFNTSSDYRLKENVQPMQNALATVAQLNPVTYTWKADGSDGQGFIAHELQAVVPDCVSGDKDAEDEDGNPVYQGIDTSFLVATLTAAIQEQQAIIESLTKRIETLEGAK